MTLTTLPLSEPCGTLTYREAGAGAPVVLIHGVGMQSAAWTPQIAALSATHRVIAIDMPGHGGSSALPSGSQLPAFVAWLHAVFAALDLTNVSLVGHSMGALVTMGYAVTHPDALARAAVLNGVYRRSPQARAAVTARADLIRTGRFDLQTPLARWFGDRPEDQAAKDQVAAWLRDVDPDGYATAYGAFARGDDIYADRFGDITCPFLAITGEGDLNSTPDMCKAMAAAAPDGQAVVIAGHRHMVNLTAPDAVSNALATWLASSSEKVPS
ncbi:alpha/beta hydrolase [Aliiroseovarius subalbicans]|uniref:alpha/beta fold hydrolase n=1 Tax=Aliiroseovarius subalbicans TaxID=2925840 RepID=UPI001F582989|nr:alpha/beta hydrolase [Aliiroseovarius subalbicans]MCI2397922.1 alpha/beta hydrolase [Aliiroseovarius subalbicans]